jgi:NAD+ kinase
MAAVGLVVHAGRESAVATARSLTGWLREQQVRSRSLEGEPVGADEEHPPATFAEGLGLILSVGGDGTLLRAAHLASAGSVPVLGINLGRLGFLTEIDPACATDLLAEILAGRMLLEERITLTARSERAPWRAPQWAMNEVIVEKRARQRLTNLAAYVGGEYVTTFAADGVIVATPTGSTAYSFSARGPIVSPKVPALLLTPVSPHMVFDRAIVLSPEEGVTLEVLGEEPALLSADGRPGLELPVGSRVTIERSDRPALLVRRASSPSFYTLLRQKFALPGAPPNPGPGAGSTGP